MSPNATPVTDNWSQERERLVANLNEGFGRIPIDDERVRAAMLAVPRHAFVPRSERSRAYQDRPLPIGHGVTISQPYIVALMTQLLELEADSRVLEIGTGSGYQAAVLAEITPHVWTIEIIEPLGVEAEARLAELGYDSVSVRVGDGYAGWPEEAPFDRIILTAAPDEMPRPLIDQLAVGGRIVAPIGPVGGPQSLVVLEKLSDGSVERRDELPVSFVPMTGQAQDD